MRLSRTPLLLFESDERIRQLERRYHKTGSDEDRAAFYRAKYRHDPHGFARDHLHPIVHEHRKKMHKLRADLWASIPDWDPHNPPPSRVPGTDHLHGVAAEKFRQTAKEAGIENPSLHLPPRPEKQEHHREHISWIAAMHKKLLSRDHGYRNFAGRTHYDPEDGERWKPRFTDDPQDGPAHGYAIYGDKQSAEHYKQSMAHHYPEYKLKTSSYRIDGLDDLFHEIEHEEPRNAWRKRQGYSVKERG